MRYTVEIDLEAADTSQALAILAAPPGSLVLDVGAADGSVAHRLVERDCRVIAIESDSAAASVAERHCERVVVGDVESLDLADAVDGLEFDVVLLLDVLEHLRDPLMTLKAAAGRVKPGGRVIISVPNVTHSALRLQLLAGRFQYTELGLLDRTHLHMFDRPALEQLVAEAGLTVLDRMRTTAGLTETEIPIDPDAFPQEAIALALSGEDAETYQFVYVATPGTARPDIASLGETLQHRATEAERVRSEAAVYARSFEALVAELEQERERVAQSEAEARERLAWLESELGRRMEELEFEHEQLEHAKMDIVVKDAYLAQLQAELAPMRARLDRLEEVMGYARHRIVDRVSAATKRFPGVHRALKRVAERMAYRGR